METLHVFLTGSSCYKLVAWKREKDKQVSELSLYGRLKVLVILIFVHASVKINPLICQMIRIRQDVRRNIICSFCRMIV